MQNIKDITSNIHYETYRVRRLNESNGHFSIQASEPADVPPKANGQRQEQPNVLQANGVPPQLEVLAHEM